MASARFNLVVLTLSLGLASAAAVADEAGDVERLAAYDAFLTLFEAEEYAQARDAAQLLVEYTEASYGLDSMELVNPLINLATVQEYLDASGEAITIYGRCIDIIERAEGPFSPLMIRPLTGLGVAYHQAGEYQVAIESLQQTKLITHRLGGIHNLEQLEVIDLLTEAYVAQREFEDADREQRFALKVNERRFGADDPEVVPAIYRLAQWFLRTGQHTEARALYERAVEVMESSYGENDLRLVEALKGIARTYSEQGVRRADGEKALKRAAGLYAADPSVDAFDHADALVSLGDWYILTGRNKPAQQAYRAAWERLAADGASDEAALKFLGKPVRLKYVPPHPDSGGMVWSLDQYRERYVDIEFTVRADGRVVDAKVVGAEAPNRIKRQVREAILQARYRPRFEDGSAVDTKGVRLRQTFYDPAGAVLPAVEERKELSATEKDG